MRLLAFGLLLALAGCNRHQAADVTLDADAAQRNATAAKTLADIAAADAASRGPAPAVHDTRARPETAQAPVEADQPEAEEAPSAADADEVQGNE
jgi:hypothetical protein